MGDVGLAFLLFTFILTLRYLLSHHPPTDLTLKVMLFAMKCLPGRLLEYNFKDNDLSK